MRPTIESNSLATRQYPVFWVATSLFMYVLLVENVFGESQDWQNYNNLFDGLRVGGSSAETLERTEIGFKYLSLWLLNFSLSNSAVYSLIAAGAIFIKLVALNYFSRSRFAYFIAIIFYLLCVSPLHEMTQIRAAVATSFLYLCYMLILSRNYRFAPIAFVLALSFHLSAATLLPMLFIVYCVEKGWIALTRVKIIFLGAAVFSLAAIAILIVLQYLEDFLLVIQIYIEEGFGEEPVNAFSATVLLNCFMISAGIVFWNSLSANMRYILLFQVFGLGVFFATLEFQVISLRLYELIQSFWVFFVVDGVGARDRFVRSLTVCYAIVAATGYSYIYLIRGDFFL